MKTVQIQVNVDAGKDVKDEDLHSHIVDALEGLTIVESVKNPNDGTAIIDNVEWIELMQSE